MVTMMTSIGDNGMSMALADLVSDSMRAHREWVLGGQEAQAALSSSVDRSVEGCAIASVGLVDQGPAASMFRFFDGLQLSRKVHADSFKH